MMRRSPPWPGSIRVRMSEVEVARPAFSLSMRSAMVSACAVVSIGNLGSGLGMGRIDAIDSTDRAAAIFCDCLGFSSVPFASVIGALWDEALGRGAGILRGCLLLDDPACDGLSSALSRLSSPPWPVPLAVMIRCPLNVAARRLLKGMANDWSLPSHMLAVIVRSCIAPLVSSLDALDRQRVFRPVLPRLSGLPRTAMTLSFSS